MLNVNTTKITIVDETRECLSRQMMLTYSVRKSYYQSGGRTEREVYYQSGYVYI